MKKIAPYILASIVVFCCQKNDLADCARNKNNGAGGSVSLSCNINTVPTIISDGTGSTFDVTLFLQALTDSISIANGYQIAIAYQGNIVATSSNGLARKEVDCYLEMNDCNPINIASQTKIITAAAVLQLLDANNLTLDSLIWPHFPPDWNISNYARTLSFRHFLYHRTALPGVNSVNINTSNWDAVRTYVTTATPDPSIQGATLDGNQYAYRNLNYAAMRIIIPSLWKRLGTGPSELNNSDITDQISRTYYERYVQDFILNPAGVTGARLTTTGFSPANSSTLFYSLNLPEDSNGEAYEEDWRAHGGGGGWVMRAVDVARVMMAISDSVVISGSNVNLMQIHPTLTWSMFLNLTNSPRGFIFAHGGDLQSRGERMHGTSVSTQDGVHITIMVNSQFIDLVNRPNAGSNALFNLVVQAYLNSWS